MPKTGVAPLATVIAAAALIGFGWASTVEADYYPGDNTPGYYTVGSGGAKVQNQGSLDAADVVSAWNTWTSTSKLSTGTTGCGTSTSCFIMVDEGQTLNGTSCTVPYLSDSNPTQYGVAYQIIYGGNNIGDSDCNSLAQSSYAVFVLVLNYSLLHSNTTAKLHVQRHEAGHGMGLPDAPTVSCYSEWGYYLPVMNNGTQASTYCSIYPSNYTATYNEALYAVIRSGW